MRSFADSEENRTDEDREYREEYEDDYTEGATSHPISKHLLRMAKVEMIVLTLLSYHTMVGLAW